jgi:pseudouridine-5'-phosphate glycosidase
MKAPPFPSWLHVESSVAAALAAGEPVVALESTVITHGLPRPTNLDLAREMEDIVRENGAHPATVAVLDGKVRLGLSEDEVERLALSEQAWKISRRDLAAAVARGADGGTTVAATMLVAHAGGVRLFATGGIGGVHRHNTGDVSADLPELGRTAVCVVCAGAKAILDLERTLEWLETAGVPVLGWQTDEFPAFYSVSSGLPVSARIDSPEQAAALLTAHWGLGLPSGVLLCAPCPVSAALPPEQVEAALAQAEADAAQAGVRGKDITPFLLARLAEISEGATLRANLALLKNNAALAARIARAFASR